MSGLLQSLTFATPFALAGLIALPIIWWLLRFVPPKPEEVRFPPIRILLGLDSPEVTPDKTPWWLLLLRLMLAALLILGVSHPLWSPNQVAAGKSGPLMLIVDNGWAAAKNWQARQDMMREILEDAQSSSSPVILATTAPVAGKRELVAVSATQAIEQAATIEPLALTANRAEFAAALSSFKGDAPSRIIWLSDGVGAADAEVFGAIAKDVFPAADKAVLFPGRAEMPTVISSVKLDGSDIQVSLLTAREGALAATVQARTANGRILTEQSIELRDGKGEARIALPIELRNEIQSIVVANENHAGSRYLLDDRWRRKTVAAMSGSSFELEQPLLSPLHYVSRALEPYADVSEPDTPEDLRARLAAGLSMLVLADIGRLPDDQLAEVQQWVEKGGVLVRFAGPRLAAANDTLVPVQLREGGRELGSSLSWEEPQGLQSISQTSPFAGLSIDSNVKVARQVLADPDATLPDKTWVSLADGTPMVTAERRGKGLIVLFHVTANADWSNLPLSGMFVDMLRRLNDLAPAAGSSQASATALAEAGQAFTPRVALSGRGELVTPEASAKPITAAAFDKTVAGPNAMPGLYDRNGQDRAINLAITAKDLTPITSSFKGWSVGAYAPRERLELAPYLFSFAFLLFLIDGIASLIIGGALKGYGRKAAATLVIALLLLPHGDDAVAQTNEKDAAAALQTSLAYIETGDADVDEVSKQGLEGLGLIVSDRTSAELGLPKGINLEQDDLVFYPLIYWPIIESAQEPSAAALAKIEKYMKNGGTLFFDLREDGLDADALSGGASANSEALRRILGKLDIPPLTEVDENHVLTKTFYLLREFPGRYDGGKLWVEATGTGTAKEPGAADGVSAIIIGSNDYAAAWALDQNYEPLFSVSPGNEQQREFAFRTGVNIVMYALTGNYKADQVHVPALLERLGQ